MILKVSLWRQNSVHQTYLSIKTSGIHSEKPVENSYYRWVCIICKQSWDDNVSNGDCQFNNVI